MLAAFLTAQLDNFEPIEAARMTGKLDQIVDSFEVSSLTSAARS